MAASNPQRPPHTGATVDTNLQHPPPTPNAKYHLHIDLDHAYAPLQKRRGGNHISETVKTTLLYVREEQGMSTFGVMVLFIQKILTPIAPHPFQTRLPFSDLLEMARKDFLAIANLSLQPLQRCMSRAQPSIT